MLNVVANAYADSKEKIDKIIAALENDDFVIAFNGATNIVIMEEVVEEESQEVEE